MRQTCLNREDHIHDKNEVNIHSEYKNSCWQERVGDKVRVTGGKIEVINV